MASKRKKPSADGATQPLTRDEMVTVQAAEILPSVAAAALMAAGWSGQFFWVHPSNPKELHRGQSALMKANPDLAARLLGSGHLASPDPKERP